MEVGLFLFLPRLQEEVWPASKSTTNRSKMGEDSERHVVSFSNFNPVALFSLILLAIGVILASVGLGIGQWARLDTNRVNTGNIDGSTFKTQSLLSRCVSYELTQQIVEQGEQQPESGCLAVSSINCLTSGLPLVSSLDNTTHNELHNSDNENSCNQMKTTLQVSAAFVILGIITNFISMLLFFPLWHYGFFIAGSVLSLTSVILYAVGIGVFLEQEQDFAGYFSLDGAPQSGCLSYGFGIALSAFIVNIIGTVLGLLAICYKKLCPRCYTYTISNSYKSD